MEKLLGGGRWSKLPPPGTFTVGPGVVVMDVGDPA